MLTIDTPTDGYLLQEWIDENCANSKDITVTVKVPDHRPADKIFICQDIPHHWSVVQGDSIWEPFGIPPLVFTHEFTCLNKVDMQGIKESDCGEWCCLYIADMLPITQIDNKLKIDRKATNLDKVRKSAWQLYDDNTKYYINLNKTVVAIFKDFINMDEVACCLKPSP